MRYPTLVTLKHRQWHDIEMLMPFFLVALVILSLVIAAVYTYARLQILSPIL